MARPIVAILTDFGTTDHYVGAMKGVILGICPEATLVDLTHDVPPQDVETAAWELAAAYRYFPPGSVFLVVVDPGVGTARRGLAVETAEHRFVAPDNGVLTLVLRESPLKRAVDLTSRRYARPTVSRTFEGRDRFAPAAAWLARGVQLTALGRGIADVGQLPIQEVVQEGDRVRGRVVRVDRFGNLITNIERRTLDRMTTEAQVRIRAGTVDVERLVATYGEIEPGQVCALIGSSDHLEICLNGASAAGALGLGRGADVEVARIASSTA